MKIHNSLVVGCSFAKGYGLQSEQDDPKLWANQLLKSVGITNVNNVSATGVNNDWIFQKALAELVKAKYDVVLVCWTAIPRFNVKVGLELYNTNTNLNKSPDVNINTRTFKSKWLQGLYNDLIQLHNDHWDFLNVVKYVNTLLEIQTSRNQQIFFVNSLMPLPDNYFNKRTFDAPSELSELEQQMLSVETRDDDEISKLYDMIHSQYNEYNGIRENKWLNLYQSLRKLQIDNTSASDDHPGYASQDLYAEYLIPKFKQLLESM